MLCRCCFFIVCPGPKLFFFAIVSLHPHQLQVLHGQSGRAAPVQVDCLHIIDRTAAVTRGKMPMECHFLFFLLILDYNLLIVSIFIYVYYYVYNNVWPLIGWIKKYSGLLIFFLKGRQSSGSQMYFLKDSHTFKWTSAFVLTCNLSGGLVGWCFFYRGRWSFMLKCFFQHHAHMTGTSTKIE